MPARAFSEHLGERIARLEPHFTVLKPERDGVYPTVLMLHGCGGPRPFIAEMAEVAVRAGAAAVIIDSYAPRRIGTLQAYATVCTGAMLHGRERAGDLYAAFAWTRAQPWADRDRIATMGWSHGGWTILDALSLRRNEMERVTGLRGLPDEPLDGLAGAMVVYPYTGIGSYVGQRAWRMTPKHAAAIVAQHDYIVGEARGALEAQRKRGDALDIHFFEGATHAFEDAEAADVRVRFNANATAREHDLLRGMITAL